DELSDAIGDAGLSHSAEQLTADPRPAATALDGKAAAFPHQRVIGRLRTPQELREHIAHHVGPRRRQEAPAPCETAGHVIRQQVDRKAAVEGVALFAVLGADVPAEAPAEYPIALLEHEAQLAGVGAVEIRGHHVDHGGLALPSANDDDWSAIAGRRQPPRTGGL